MTISELIDSVQSCLVDNDCNGCYYDGVSADKERCRSNLGDVLCMALDVLEIYMRESEENDNDER